MKPVPSAVYRHYAQEAHAMGLRMEVAHDPEGRHVAVTLYPHGGPRGYQAAEAMRQSMRETTDTAEKDLAHVAIEAGVTYAEGDPTDFVIVATARTALDRAKEVL